MIGVKSFRLNHIYITANQTVMNVNWIFFKGSTETFKYTSDLKFTFPATKGEVPTSNCAFVDILFALKPV